MSKKGPVKKRTSFTEVVLSHTTLEMATKNKTENNFINDNVTPWNYEVIVDENSEFEFQDLKWSNNIVKQEFRHQEKIKRNSY